MCQYRDLIAAGLQDDIDRITTAAQDIGFVWRQTKREHFAQVIAMIRQVFAELPSAPQITFANKALSRKMQ